MKIPARGLGIRLGRSVFADDLYHELPLPVSNVDEVQNRFVFWIEADVYVAIRVPMHEGYLALYCCTWLKHLQPVRLVQVLPQIWITLGSLKLYRRGSRIAESCR